MTETRKQAANQSPEEGEGTSVFYGTFQHALDDKGRVSVPVEYRGSITGGSVVVTNFICDGARCLEGFTLAQWSDFEKKLRAKSRFDPQLKKLENFYLSRAARCPIDGSGRVTIPHYLRSYASLEKDVVFTGSIHGFRIWEKRVWDLVFSEAEAALLENPSLFKDVDL